LDCKFREENGDLFNQQVSSCDCLPLSHLYIRFTFANNGPL